MIGINKAQRPLGRLNSLVAATLLIPTTACSRDAARSTTPPATSTLVVGVGVGTVANPQAGIQQAIGNIALEGLLDFGRDGRARPWLAEKWSSSADGLVWRVSIRPNATFHDGEQVSAAAVREILLAQLPKYLQGPYEDVSDIRTVSDRELEIVMKRPSTFLVEALEMPIQRPGKVVVATGPFFEKVEGDGIEMRAYPNYYEGRPVIDRVVFNTYPSVRSAWAEMLRGKVDVLYEVGTDALDLVMRSSQINVFTFQRPYVYAVLFNVQRTQFKERRTRRALNAAIDRKTFIDAVLRGHGTPADGPISPSHWARDAAIAGFTYAPLLFASPSRPLRATCIFGDPSYERMGLEVQRQLQAVGVQLTLEAVDGDTLLERLNSRNFDCAVIDVISGPNLLRPYWFWHSSGPFNWGSFESKNVDEALDAIRHALNDDEYRRAIAAFQRAILDDPPAIFLAWSERARAVSTRFDVPAEPGRDILSTLRFWRPVADNRIATHN